MNFLIQDKAGQIIGNYKVLRLDDEKNKNHYSGKHYNWLCECVKCKSIISIPSNMISLRTCKNCKIQEQLEKLQAIDTGRLKVIGYAYSKNKKRYWECLCSCGNKIILDTNSLMSGNTRSCGCLQKEHSREIGKRLLTVDMLNKVFGDWAVIEQAERPPDKKREGAYWKLRCNLCGEEKILAGTDIRRRKYMLCSTKNQHSSNENYFARFLSANHIHFVQEKTFEHLTGVSGGQLRYDFYIDDKSAPFKTPCLIEIQGAQHYRAVDFYGGEQGFQQRLLHDKEKRDYALAHNIPLFIIPDTKIQTLTLKDLDINSSEYLWKGESENE